MATVDDKKIIFSMVGVSKAFQANKQVLKNIYLSFFYGAKIGIIKEGQVDVFQYLLVRLEGLAHAYHRKDNFFIVYCCHFIEL